MAPNASPILLGFLFAGLVALRAQQTPPAVPEWQAAAGGKLAFEVASVKPSTESEFRGPNFPLDNGDAFINLMNGELPRGRFSARFPLSVYVTFAYKFRPSPDQRRAMPAPLPKWVWSDMYDIEARAPMSNATKDEMRLMMQCLLAERFHLAAHFENQTVPVFALVLAKPGKLGPNLRPHESGPPCDTAGGNRPQDRDVFRPIAKLTRSRCSRTARADWVPTYNDGSAGQFHPYDGRCDAARGGPHRAFRQVRFQAGMGA